jgi:hypothetical protein
MNGKITNLKSRGKHYQWLIIKAESEGHDTQRNAIMKFYPISSYIAFVKLS